MKNIYLLFICTFLSYGCASVQKTEIAETPKNNYPSYNNISGPKGTDISTIYSGHGQKIGFMAKIAKNIGLSRTEYETSKTCYKLKNGDNITWDFEKLRGTKDFRTPIDLVTLSNKNQTLFKQRIQDNISWNEYPLNDVIIPLDLYLDRQNASYNLALKDNLMRLYINNENYSFAINNYDTLTLCLGLRRSELLRWTGQVVPAQALNVIIPKAE